MHQTGAASPAGRAGRDAGISRAVAPAGPANRTPIATIVDVQPPRVALAGATRMSFGGKGSDPDGDAFTFTWDFGDDEGGVDEGVAHVYHREGVFE